MTHLMKLKTGFITSLLISLSACATIEPQGKFCVSRPNRETNPCNIPAKDKDGKVSWEHSSVAYSDTNGWYLIEPKEYKAQIKAAGKNQ
jgi:hypothetical protein